MATEHQLALAEARIEELADENERLREALAVVRTLASGDKTIEREINAALGPDSRSTNDES